MATVVKCRVERFCGNNPSRWPTDQATVGACAATPWTISVCAPHVPRPRPLSPPLGPRHLPNRRPVRPPCPRRFIGTILHPSRRGPLWRSPIRAARRHCRHSASLRVPACPPPLPVAYASIDRCPRPGRSRRRTMVTTVARAPSPPPCTTPWALEAPQRARIRAAPFAPTRVSGTASPTQRDHCPCAPTNPMVRPSQHRCRARPWCPFQ